MGNISTNYVDGIGGFMIDILKVYQVWRRGDDERTLEDTGLTPAMIGEAIDWVIGVAEERDTLAAQVERLRVANNEKQLLLENNHPKMTIMLISEVNELKAQVEQLRKGFSDLQSCSLNSEYNKTLSKIRVIFNATPAQCLAEVRAQAGRHGFIAGYFHCRRFGFQFEDDLESQSNEYANKIRQQAKGNTYE